MTYLNEYEVEDAARLFAQDDGVPNLQQAAFVLQALVDWTNGCSDGWVYWQKPRQAATRLVKHIEMKRREYLRGNPVLDITPQDLRQALVPIKSFLTKQGVDYHSDLPWAAVFPEAATL